MKKKYTKLFYDFLVENGVLFQFMQAIVSSRYGTLIIHCERNRPEKYIEHTSLIFSKKPLIVKINGKFVVVAKDSNVIDWFELDKKWKEQVQIIKTKKK